MTVNLIKFGSKNMDVGTVFIKVTKTFYGKKLRLSKRYHRPVTTEDEI